MNLPSFFRRSKEASERSIQALNGWFEKNWRTLKETGTESDEAAGILEEMEGALDAASEYEADLESKLALAQSTIEELQRNLADLAPLGDKLGEAEKGRMLLEKELEALRANRAQSMAIADKEFLSTLSAVEGEIVSLRTKVAKLEKEVAKERERADKAVAKYEDRRAVAAERWDELVALRKELRALEGQLAIDRLVDEDELSEPPVDGIQDGSLADLMRPEDALEEVASEPLEQAEPEQAEQGTEQAQVAEPEPAALAPDPVEETQAASSKKAARKKTQRKAAKKRTKKTATRKATKKTGKRVAKKASAKKATKRASKKSAK